VEVLAEFPPELECGPGGAVLVRPDGFIAWKKETGATDGDIRTALNAALR
jgi:hypothetical protein